MKKVHTASHHFPIVASLLVGLLCGCAGGWAVVTPKLSQENRGRIVEAVELNDGQVVFFDRFDPAGPGQDTRARMDGESIEGPVDGILRTFSLADVKKVMFGVDEDEVSSQMVYGLVFFGVIAMVFIFVSLGTNL